MAEFLSIIIPTLDEEHYLARCIRSLMDEPYDSGQFEILVVDGGSTDRTIEVANDLATEFPQIRVLRNPARVQSAAFNLAVKNADRRSTCFLRCDAHAEYAPGFARRAVASLKESGAGVVGYAAVPAADGDFQRAVAFAQSTRAGVGGSEYRQEGRSGWVDSAMHGCFSAEAVKQVGGYDESFTHNEDAELSLRLRQAGYGVWLDSGLKVGYFPRSTPSGLARQYFLYGRGRARTCLKHRIAPKPRQIAPVLLVVANVLTIALGMRRRSVLLVPLAYLAAIAGIAALAAGRRRDPVLLMSAPALAIMHHTWGSGFLGETISELADRAARLDRESG